MWLFRHATNWSGKLSSKQKEIFWHFKLHLFWRLKHQKLLLKTWRVWAFKPSKCGHWMCYFLALLMLLFLHLKCRNLIMKLTSVCKKMFCFSFLCSITHNFALLQWMIIWSLNNLDGTNTWVPLLQPTLLSHKSPFYFCPYTMCLKSVKKLGQVV